VWHHFVVGCHVELNETTESREIVQGVQVEPRVLQGSPEGLNHGVGKGHLDLMRIPAIVNTQIG
jgi:hypothetical protein